MFVKWSQRSRAYKQRHWRKEQEHRTLVVQLAETQRIDGKTWKVIVAHLGTCREPTEEVRHRIWFYRRCDETLDRLGNRLSTDDRAIIENALATRLPRPTAAEIEARDAKVAAIMGKFRPDPFVALVNAWNDADEATQERFLGELRKIGVNAGSSRPASQARAAVHKLQNGGQP